MATTNVEKSLESWIWDAACSIRGAKDAGKYKDFILPLIFTKRLCDVFDDELNRIAKEVGSRSKAFKLVKHDKKLVRFFLPLEPKNPDEAVWSVVRTLSDKIGEQLTTHLRSIADANPLLKGIIDRVDFNATTHGQRDIDDDRLSNLIEAISAKHLGLADVEADIIGRSYEYLIRKFAEGSGQSAGEFYTPPEVAQVMARIMNPQPGMDVYDPCCGSAGLLIKCRLAVDEKRRVANKKNSAPVKLFGQENEPGTWAMANMNMIIHDMEGDIQIGDTFRRPKFRAGNRLQTFDRVVANPMWNQTEFKEKDYDADQLDRFPKGAGFPGNKADWGWMQHILASTKPTGRAAVVLDMGAASRGSGSVNSNKEKDVRRWFVENDLVEGVIQLPENLFYNMNAPGIIIVLNRAKTKERRGRFILVNASREFVKGDPKNYIPDKAIEYIADTFSSWKTIRNFSRIVTLEEIAKNDFRLSPSRYVHIGEGQEHRPLVELVEELSAAEDQSTALVAALNRTLSTLLPRFRRSQKNSDLPNGWRFVPIGEVFTFTRKPKGLKIANNEMVPFLPMDSVPAGRVFVRDYDQRLGSSLGSGTYVENGDLIVAKITPSFENGKQAIIHWDKPFGFATTEVIPLKEIPGVSSKEYLFHLLLHPPIRSELAGKMEGSTGRQRLSKELLSSYEIPFPPLLEQKRIASLLGLIRRSIEQQAATIQTKSTLNRALLDQLITGEVRVHDLDLSKLDGAVTQV